MKHKIVKGEMMKDIVVTGMGVLSTAGFTLDDYWHNLYDGKVTYGMIDEFKSNPNYRIKIGSKIKTSKWNTNVPEDILSTYGKAACYAVSTTLKAIHHAKIDLNQVNNKRVGVVIGTTMGEIEVEEQITKFVCQNKSIDNRLYQQYQTFNIVKAVAEAVGAKGYMFAVPAACAAGNYAVAISKQLLEWDYADMIITGGVDVFSKVAFAGFQRLLSLATDFCRPFDKNRKGLVVGEGCGIVILEKEKQRKNQKVFGRIVGSGLSSNAYHMTAPHIHGEGELLAMKKAMMNTGLSLKDIDYISAHGTGTKANDKIEAKVIKEMFKGHNLPPVSSIKSVLGHSMGAASTLELIACLLMIQRRTILPTMNYQSKDEDCDIDVVANKPRKQNLKYVMSNSFAFGGQTSSLVIGV
ncbi:beta-ketoacyl-[acyl-carrier-protein] synthase family protein [Vallitalea pronyensis]|uniref:Beta-ketoacyl-[acyl-carrier-protein] synthase family protein n=1 Tax=Vallitalea pronyensis TaxID=1348613 RepID=A0A8J8MHQ2_9FIRM|nr:beta-ketoacyl-[acyl-carrier-protein] synthase family protein [Vallitalea pronyensis]QUI21855.1 beta-ketoacyl-[acyl-carrier-protein] synthase family protein [Vallitalea pronyensis]